MESRKLYLDTTERAFVTDETATIAAFTPLLFEGDVERIELYFLKRTGQAGAPYDYANYSTGITATLRLGTPSSSAALTSFTAITTSITITASETIAGGSGISEVQRAVMSPAPRSGFYSLQLPTRNVTVSSVTASTFVAAYHALINNQSVTLTAFSTPSGFSNGAAYFVRDRARDTFRIAITAGGSAITASVASGGGTAVVPTYTTQPLRAMAAPVEVGAALAAAAGSSTQQIAVAGTATDYNLSYGGNYAGAAMPTVAVTGNTLAGPSGLAGNFNLGVSAITGLVAAGTTDVVLEVSTTNGTLTHTYQMPARLGNDL
jgi:hypothetical protein